MLNKGDNMKKQFIGHHGDIGIFSIKSVPAKAKFIGEFKSFTAQEGETTGHKHQITSVESFKVYEVDGHFVYILSTEAEITHEEHKARTIPKGIIYQDQELEESPQDGLIHKVID